MYSNNTFITFILLLLSCCSISCCDCSGRASELLLLAKLLPCLCLFNVFASTPPANISNLNSVPSLTNCIALCLSFVLVLVFSISFHASLIKSLNRMSELSFLLGRLHQCNVLGSLVLAFLSTVYPYSSNQPIYHISYASL
jgi:hypothetical protein